MKQTPQEQQVYANFLPGKITKEGFLGEDPRHIHDIIEADARTLAHLGVTTAQIADRLQYFIEEGKKGLETPVTVGNFVVQATWDRGMLPSPFGASPAGEPRRLYHKIVATVQNTTLNRSLRYTQLNVHMIRDHGFFEGQGSVFRLEPAEVVAVLDIQPEAPAPDNGKED